MLKMQALPPAFASGPGGGITAKGVPEVAFKSPYLYERLSCTAICSMESEVWMALEFIS